MAQAEHVYSVEDIVRGQGTRGHMTRMSPYADNSLGIMEALRYIFNKLKNQREFQMNTYWAI